MSKVQTDNSYSRYKVFLRKKYLPQKEKINILDVFSGDCKIWNSIKKNKLINILRMEKKADAKGVYLKGDNVKFLKSIELNKYDVIDLDAYGIPYRQLEILFKRKYKGIIYITFIQSMFGQINYTLLQAIGYTKDMIRKCPTLFNKNGFDKFCEYLSINGIKKINYIKKINKYYIQLKMI